MTALHLASKTLRPLAPFASLTLASLALTACASAPVDRNVAQQQVMVAERAFAKSMADRNFVTFQGYLSKDAVFFGDKGTYRGKEEIATAWWQYYAGPTAPFSWEPTQVEVIDTGHLALSTGPVKDPRGRRIATFNTVWREEEPGVWRVIFDKGCECDCAR